MRKKHGVNHLEDADLETLRKIAQRLLMVQCCRMAIVAIWRT